MPRGLYRFEGPVLCQRCHQVFERPKSLAPWVPATKCEPCWAYLDDLEAQLVLTRRNLRQHDGPSDIKARRQRRETIQILHPLLMDVEKTTERKPGQPGWMQAELEA